MTGIQFYVEGPVGQFAIGRCKASGASSESAFGYKVGSYGGCEPGTDPQYSGHNFRLQRD
jgi:hypothetical protein